MSVLEVALDRSTVIVAVDPGKAFNRYGSVTALECSLIRCRCRFREKVSPSLSWR
jgi:hypothetical protein